MAWNTTSQVTGTNDVAQISGNTSANQGTNNQQNTYNPQQAALQGQIPGLYQTLLAGNIPKTFTSPQAVIDNYNTQFDTWQAPQIAVNGGAGSPMMAANKAIGESNLLANLYNQGVGNYMQGLSGANSAAMTPTGQNAQTTSANTAAGTHNTNQQYKQDTNQTYAAIQNILDILQQLPGGF